ncbi:MAG: DUF4202 domain-containing protein [Ilumatobacteraceae bacterium]
MCGLSGSALFVAACAAIDAANADDPGMVDLRGAGPRPLAQVHGELAAEWVGVLAPDADELVLLAARAHHLRRWELPRSHYPTGRAGYLQWKRDQRRRHADDAGALLTTLGFTAEDVAQVQAMVLRQGEGGQLVEDAACLVFIETQLAAVATQLDHDHLLDVIRKTAKKMSPAALVAVSRIPLGEAEQALLAAALS